MRIAHVISSLDPLGGGPPLIVVRLAAEAARRGHDVRVFSYQASNAQVRIDAMIGSLPGADRVTYVNLPAPSRAERFLSNKTRQRLDTLFADIQIVHLQGVWDPILKAAATVSHRRGIPYVVAPQGMLDPWSLSQKRWKKKLALFMGYKAMLNRAAFLQLLNRDEQELLAPLGLTSQMRIIPNGIATEEFSDLPPAGTFRSAHPELGSAPYILFLSRLHYKKGLDVLAKAFAHVARKDPVVQLVVAGADDGVEASFRSDIQAAGLQARVHLVGPIFGKEKLAALVDAACFCLPSRQEGFSVAILEAMACGLPVVITIPCHFPEVAEHRAGLVVPLDPAEIAGALEKVLADPGQMGIAGRALILDRFTWPKVTEMLILTYEDARR